MDVYVCVCVCVGGCVCGCVCMCVWERERGKKNIKMKSTNESKAIRKKWKYTNFAQKSILCKKKITNFDENEFERDIQIFQKLTERKLGE